MSNITIYKSELSDVKPFGTFGDVMRNTSLDIYPTIFRFDLYTGIFYTASRPVTEELRHLNFLNYKEPIVVETAKLGSGVGDLSGNNVLCFSMIPKSKTNSIVSELTVSQDTRGHYLHFGSAKFMRQLVDMFVPNHKHHSSNIKNWFPTKGVKMTQDHIRFVDQGSKKYICFSLEHIENWIHSMIIDTGNSEMNVRSLFSS